MDVRHFFTHQIGYGKFLGAFFGFLTAGPLGALCGLLIGNFFDKGMSNHYSKPFWHYVSEKNQQTKQTFLTSLFLLLGHIAKQNGRITKSAIHLAENIMQQMELTAAEKIIAKNAFNEGKQATFITQRANILRKLRNSIENNRPLLQLFINTTYQAMQLNGSSITSFSLMNEILHELNIAPMHQQAHFFEDFQPNFSSQQSYQRYAPQKAAEMPIHQAYAELNITPEASAAEVKRAYRRLMSKHHPDKLIAKGLSEDKIKAANEKTQRIRKAYDLICQQKK